MNRDRIDMPEWPGVIWLEVGPSREWSEFGGDGWFRPPTMPAGEGRLVHVMSAGTQGEIRAYVISLGVLHLRSPCYTGEWTVMDLAVCRALGAIMAPYTVTAGGAVVARLAAGQLGLFGVQP